MYIYRFKYYSSLLEAPEHLDLSIPVIAASLRTKFEYFGY